MEKRLQKSTKENVSDSLTLDHRILDGPSSWSRCDSFSSCSNDSAVYCSTHHIQSASFKVGKHLNAEGAMHLTKRKRNSSGSSVSSNLSCISDKDNKKLPLIISPSSVPESSVCNSDIKGNATDISILSCSEISPNDLELEHETILNKRLSCSDRSSSISSRHNLRRNIRKKTCGCDCSATCTTVVFRHYKDGKNTVKEKTVISSTKVKTFIQKSPEQNMLKLTHSSSIKPESGRKRRSEVEKLYDSLHEIEWAKNFSPDNILRQINIRQAASCSVFGRPSTNLANSEEKIHVQSKIEDKSYCAKNRSHDSVGQKSESLYKTRQNFSDLCSNKCTRMKGESHSSNTEQKRTNAKSENKIVNSNGHVEHSDYKDCSKASVAHINLVQSCSVARINLKKYLTSSNDSHESKLQTKSFITVNDAEYLDDAHLSSASDESSSGSTVGIHTKNFSDFDFISNSTTDTATTASNVTESTISPLFFDITEQGLLTMGACFREVGAEVVVSTCHENEHELPLLTSIKDAISNKIISDDEPPILERCDNITEESSDFRIKKLSMNGSSNNVAKKKTLLAFKSNVKKKHKNAYAVSNIKRKNFHNIPQRVYKSRFAHRRFINPLVTSAGKQIFKKYFKYIHSKGKKLYHSPSSKSENSAKFNTELDDTHSDSLFRTTAHIKSDLSNPSQLKIPKASSFSATCLNFQKSISGIKKDTTTTLNSSNQNIPACKYPGKLILDCTKNGSCISCAKKEPLIHLNESKKALRKTHLVTNSPDNFAKHRSLMPSPYSSIKTESKTKKPQEEHILRPPASLGFSCHYQSIRVNRNNNYIQVVLKQTRGKSVFLTLEALTELRDVVKRAGRDVNCQVLIVNGVGDCFCLGLDLEPLIGPRKIKASSEIAVAVKELILALSDLRKPLVAVVNGSAFGLGMTLLHHADVAIASDKATFCMPYSCLGYIPEGGATLTLPQVVGSTMAMDLMTRGRTLTAHQACSIGLISEVVEENRLPQELVSRVKMLTANSMSAMDTTKAMLRMRLHLELELVLENEVKLLPTMWLSRACQDALQSALHSGFLAG